MILWMKILLTLPLLWAVKHLLSPRWYSDTSCKNIEKYVHCKGDGENLNNTVIVIVLIKGSIRMLYDIIL